MSETKTPATPEKDPMELPENHFAQQEIDAEKQFLENYAQPPIQTTPGITEQEPTPPVEGAEGAEGTEGDPKPDGSSEGDPDEPFKFDDAIAEAEKAELEELNAKLGTDYKDLSELKAAYKKEDENAELQQIETEKTYINYFKSVLDPKKYDDRRIVYEDEKMIAQDAGKDITDPQIIEEINTKIDGLEQNGVLQYAANTIRQTVKTALAQKEAIVQAFDDKQKATRQQTAAQRKESLQNSINEVYKAGEFLGITPTKEDMLDIYKDISADKHIDHLKSNPKDAVQFALFKKYQSVIEKNLGKPDYKAGVKDTLEKIGLSGSEQTSKGANDQGSDEGEKSYFEQFVK